MEDNRREAKGFSGTLTSRPIAKCGVISKLNKGKSTSTESFVGCLKIKIIILSKYTHK